MPLNQAPTNLPIIRLNDIEQDSILARNPEIYYNTSNTDESDIYYDWSLFAPIQYYFSENSNLPNENEKYKRGMYYSSSISTRIYQLRFPSMGNIIISTLIKKERDFKSFTKINHKNFDQLIILEKNNNSKEIFALKGKGIIHVSYSGCADNNSIIKTIAPKIHLVSK